MTVITTVYNQEAYIAKTIKSVLAQKTNFDFEYIISDDCSSDDSAIIAKDLADKHSNVKFIRNIENLGFIDNYCQCLKLAKGIYICSIGGDDVWIDNLKLQKQYEFLETHPECGMVHTQFDHYYQRNDKWVKSILPKNDLYLKGKMFERILILNPICAITVCFRMKLIKESGLIEKFENKVYPFEDLPLWLEIARKSLVGYISDSTAMYRVNEESLSHSNHPEKKLDFIKNEYRIVMDYMQIEFVSGALKLKVENEFNIKFAVAYLQSGDLTLFEHYCSVISRWPHRLKLLYFFRNYSTLRKKLLQLLITD